MYEWYGATRTGAISGGEGNLADPVAFAHQLYDQGWRTVDIYVAPKTAVSVPVAGIKPDPTTHARVVYQT